MKIKEAIDLIKTYDNKGIETQEYVLSNRFIYNLIIMYRSFLLSQKLENNMSADGYKQTLNCVGLIEVPRIDCNCNLGVESLCTILRTSNPIPKHVGDFMQVMSLDSRKIFTQTTKDKAIYASGNRYTSRGIKWYIENDYLYIIGTPILKGISITAYFIDPIEIYESSLCSDDHKCYNALDLEINIEEEDINQIVQAVISYISNLKYVAADDTFDKKDTSFNTYTENPFKRYQSKK